MKRIFILAFISVLVACSSANDTRKTRMVLYDTLQVTSTAYNSVSAQTTADNPALAAWGDTLELGMRAIAISRDLIDSGLVHNTAVYIEGFEQPFYVLDKMNKRWRNKVDIYMGLDIDSARSWGKKQIEIYIPVDTIVVEK
ncbi:MAG: 3D (Asp-Asp-Asp) domain-containing protein [Marivirga sp.]|jgi:3D (Asp-Asp-Asp) domain-containing protein